MTTVIGISTPEYKKSSVNSWLSAENIYNIRHLLRNIYMMNKMNQSKTNTLPHKELENIVRGVLSRNHAETQRIRRGDIARIILGVIAALGIVAAGAIFPNIGGVLSLMGFGKRKSASKWYINETLQTLEKQKLIARDEAGSLRLTDKGRNRLTAYQSEPQHMILIPKKWDGKYHIAGFDIWEKSREKRNAFRKQIEAAGFIKLQNSLWVFPYECREFITLVKTDLRLGGGVIYIVADKIENDSKLREHFSLPPYN